VAWQGHEPVNKEDNFRKNDAHNNEGDGLLVPKTQDTSSRSTKRTTAAIEHLCTDMEAGGLAGLNYRIYRNRNERSLHPVSKYVAKLRTVQQLHAKPFEAQAGDQSVTR
jgi:hypothetical protein